MNQIYMGMDVSKDLNACCREAAVSNDSTNALKGYGEGQDYQI